MRLPQVPPDPNQIVASKAGEIQRSFNNKDLQDFARYCESQYFHWDQIRFRVPGDMDAQVVWALLKFGRYPRYRYTPLLGFNDQPIKYTMPDLVQSEFMLIDQQLAGRLVSEDESPLAQSQREQFIVNALREEAIASSMLEGAATTRREAKQMLRSGRKPRSRGEQMVVNNYQAIQFIRENRKVELSPQFIVELQSILTHRTLDDPGEIGRFRNPEDDVTVVDGRDNELIHTPPPANELQQRIETLCQFANGGMDEGFIHPVARACILHFQLGFDHPFCDGNGRTARALFYWSMLKSGYWLFEYLPLSRLICRAPVRYTRAFLYSETDEFDVTYFLVHSAKIIAKARRDLRKYIAEKHAQVLQARRIFSNDRSLNHRQRTVLLSIARNPDRVWTIAEHRDRSCIAYATARSDLRYLADHGYLTMLEVGKRHEFIAGPKMAEPC